LNDHETLEASEPPSNVAASADTRFTLASLPLSSPQNETPTVPGYEILDELGRGGMGIVYRAKQLDLRRLVALKMIRGGTAANAEAFIRFRTEAEAVAQVQHPNIVQIHEIGELEDRTTRLPSGCPFMALELVEGGSLAQHLKGMPQSCRSAAQLVETLARAMHFAHQRGVIHRDLKPGNVLLQTDKQHQSSLSQIAICDQPSVIPKITDFGLAKLLDEGAISHTQTGSILGTPSYMAPEQATGTGALIGVTTDVYALGAILYELITGRPPFRGLTYLETLEQARSQEPVPPRQLSPNIPRDLETICLKCLQKQQRSRYQSAEELAEDLRRFLAMESIHARPISTLERSVKWARRRPAVAALLGVSALGVIIIAVLVALFVIRLERERTIAENRRKDAEAQRQRAIAHLRSARDAIDRMAKLGFDRLASVPYAETVRREIMEDSIRFYQDLARQESDDPDLRYEIGRAHRMLGKTYGTFGEANKSEQSYRTALSLQEKLNADHPDVPSYQLELSACQNNLAITLVGQSKMADAEKLYLQAVARQEYLAAKYPNEPEYRQYLATNLDSFANLLATLKRNDEAEKTFHRSIQLLDGVVKEAPAQLEWKLSLANSNSNFGVYLARRGRLTEAEPLFRKDRDLWLQLAEQYPNNPRYRARVALSSYNLGQLLADTGHPEESEKILRQAVGFSQKLVAEFPTVMYYRTGLAGQLRKLASLVLARGKMTEGLQFLEQTLENYISALKVERDNTRTREQLINDYRSLIEYFLLLKAHREASKAATVLPALIENSAEICYFSALTSSRCLLLLDQDKQLTVDQRRELMRTYSSQAASALFGALRRELISLEQSGTPSSAKKAAK
jgi:serine/threonine protein kinase